MVRVAALSEAPAKPAEPIQLETENYCDAARQFRHFCEGLLAQMPASPTRDQAAWYMGEITRSWFERRKSAGAKHQGFGSPAHHCLGSVWADVYGLLHATWINTPPPVPKRMRRDGPPQPVLDNLA